MRYYPAMLDLRTRRVLIVGCGKIGCRKLVGLFATGAAITVIDAHADLEEIERQVAEKYAHRSEYLQEKKDFLENLVMIRRPYDTSCHQEILLASDMVFLCTNDGKLHDEIEAVTKMKGIWTLRSDRGDRSDFITPVAVEKEELVIALSTSGSSPSLARQAKERLEEWIRTIDTSKLKSLKEKRRKS